ncbi:hypothetical protein MTR_3g108820 [Medicago truncatula]|uniref:Uncharacterized protein n=1 Tax=Medicago truncatula TaxID=3880 RepID=G7JCD2_MEDTR|nr:hypothetical protein MTR_3g108820 [Medicago truncatula]
MLMMNVVVFQPFQSKTVTIAGTGIGAGELAGRRPWKESMREEIVAERGKKQWDLAGGRLKLFPLPILNATTNMGHG